MQRRPGINVQSWPDQDCKPIIAEEMQIGVNHYGHALLTRLLKPVMEVPPTLCQVMVALRPAERLDCRLQVLALSCLLWLLGSSCF